MFDALAVLQASVTKTATFNGAGFDLVTGTPNRGLVARVLYSAATNASGANSVTFSIDESDDNATFAALNAGAAGALALSPTAQAGELFLPFRTRKRYVRLTVTLGGAGATPTVTYEAQITLALP